MPKTKTKTKKRNKQKRRKNKHETLTTIHAMKPVVPEDIAPGDYIALTHETIQVLPCDTDSRLNGDTLKPLRVHIMPYDAGEPAKVLAVCLPFMTATAPQGAVLTLDLRRERYARLPKAYGKHVFKQHQVRV